MRIVIALGGNALGTNQAEQKKAIKSTVKVVADLIEQGNEVLLTHGNGPQVGMIKNALDDTIPLSACVAMSQAYIGLDIQNALREELLDRGIAKTVISLITQLSVREDDEAFLNPSKPIGSFLNKDQAEKLRARGMEVIEDSGRGYRQVVASPKPIDIVEIDAVCALVEQGQVVITCGGGGVPVVEKGNTLKEVDSVIDKDFASARLAQMVNADFLVLLTAVEKVAVNYGKPDQKWLSDMTLEQAQTYIDEGQFAPGSMLPKIQAAMEFAASQKGRQTLITMLEKAEKGIKGETGTIIVA